MKEGENLSLDCSFFDEDNDSLTITYSGWMNSSHKYIDYNSAGVHKVLVTVSDGKHVVHKTVTIHVLNTNRPPVLVVHNVEAMEGDIVTLNYSVYDPDNDPVTVTFGEPFNSQGVWQTKIGDAGVYEVTIAASDGKAVVEKKVNVTIKMRNTPPVIRAPDVVEVNEGEFFKLPVEYYDREQKSLIVTISGWMNSPSKQIGYDDAGTHLVTVSVSDGQYTTTKTITVIVHNVNRPPVFNP